MRTSSLLPALSFALVALGFLASTAADEPHEPTIALDVHEAEIGDVVAAIASFGVPLLVEPTVHARITLEARASVRDVVALVASHAGCDLRRLAGGTFVLAEGEPVTVTFADADARILVELVAALSGKNVVLLPDVRGTIDLDVRRVRWLEALGEIARRAKLHVYRRGAVVFVSAAAPPGGTRELEIDEPPPWPALPELPPDRPIDLAVVDEPVSAVVAAIGTVVGCPIRSSRTSSAVISLSVRGAPWRDLVQFLADASGCAVHAEGSGLVLEPLPLNTIEASAADAGALFETIAPSLDRPIHVAASVHRRVTVDLHSIPWAEAIRAIAWAHGFSCEEGTAGGLEITGAGVAGPDDEPAPRPKLTTKTMTVADHGEEIRKLEARVAAILGDRASLRGSIDELQATVDSMAKLRPGSVLERREAWRKLSPSDEVGDAVVLMGEIAEGNVCLAAAVRALNDRRLAEFESQLAGIEAIVADMRREPREEFERNAQRFLERVKTLREQAKPIVKKVSLDLRVMAIVVDPAADATNRVLLSCRDPEHRGHSYVEQDEVRDPRGSVVEALRVVKIQEGSVQLRLDGVDFVQEIEAP